MRKVAEYAAHLHLFGVHKDGVPHIEGMHHKYEDDGLERVPHRVAENEAEAQENAGKQHPCVANIHLPACAEHVNRDEPMSDEGDALGGVHVWLGYSPCPCKGP